MPDDGEGHGGEEVVPDVQPAEARQPGEDSVLEHLEPEAGHGEVGERGLGQHEDSDCSSSSGLTSNLESVAGSGVEQLHRAYGHRSVQRINVAVT